MLTRHRVHRVQGNRTVCGKPVDSVRYHVPDAVDTAQPCAICFREKS